MSTEKETLIHIVKGDLLKQEVEAIVNAANAHLVGGGGVDGVIHTAAGPELVEACMKYKKEKKISSIGVGDAMLTDSFEIQKITPRIHYVIHTVGPNCTHSGQNKEREQLLRKAYQNSLERAREIGVRSIAFPAISTGIYRYPFKEAQEVAIKAIEDYLCSYPGSFLDIRLVYYSEEDFKKAQSVWREAKHRSR